MERKNKAAHKSLNVALAQLSGADDAAGNADLMRQAAEKAACMSQPPDMLVFPEGFMTGYYVADAAGAALSSSAALTQLRELAAAHGMAIAAGYIECEGGVLYNAAAVVGKQGEMLVEYRKRCLYGDWERRVFTPGNNIRVFELCDWRIGIAICYDVEFPEITRALAHAGAQAVIVPTALMAPDEELVFSLLPARAIENGIFVAYANRVGCERELRYVGGSRIINPRGDILAQAGDEEGIIQAVLVQDANAPLSEYLEDVARLTQEKKA